MPGQPLDIRRRDVPVVNQASPQSTNPVEVVPGVKAWGDFAPKQSGPSPRIAEPQDMSSLPPEKQREILEAIQSITGNVSNGPAAQQPPGRPSVDLPPIQPVSQSQPSATGALIHPAECPHCGWDMTRKDIEVTDEDKITFIQAAINENENRIVKSYPLLGGQIIVTFRSLTTAETDLAVTQAVYDAETPAIKDLTQLVRVLTDYRLCLSLARIEKGVHKQSFPEWLEPGATTYDPVPPRTTVLKQVTSYIYDSALKSEPLRVMIAQTFYDFQRLIELLERQASNPNFYKVAGLA